MSSDRATVSGPARFTSLRDHCLGNRLLASLSQSDRALIEPFLEIVDLQRGDVLFEPGEDVRTTHFPTAGAMISLALLLRDGRNVEAASIGREGAVGGIVSAGKKPAFGRAVVQIAGGALRIETARLESAKEHSPSFRDLFSRYADALLAQLMQSVACNALHTLEARCCRWLLTTHDRVIGSDIPLTQEALSEMLGVQRTTVTEVAQSLQARGMISYRRGRIQVVDRAQLEHTACECYHLVEAHFARILPEVLSWDQAAPLTSSAD